MPKGSERVNQYYLSDPCFQPREEKDQEEGTHSDSTESVVEDPIEMYERNLLNHVQRVQAEISDRMDAIEEQLAGTV